MAKTVRPSGHIWVHAQQFHEAAELLWHTEGADLSRLALPLIVNYSLAAELAMKSAEGKTKFGKVVNGIIGAGTLKSAVHGHDLVQVFSDLKEGTRSALEGEFQLATGEPLAPLLERCADYFLLARYAYETMGGTYDLSGIRMLSGGLLQAVHAFALKQPH